MGLYGGMRANSGNVAFPFELALAAARDLWALAEDLEELRGRLSDATRSVREDWHGPQQRAFSAKTNVWHSSAASAETALRHLAKELAEAWAAARGEQDRINTARMAKHEADTDSWYENGLEWIVGEDDYPPPDDPPTPSPSYFAPTRSPIEPRWGI